MFHTASWPDHIYVADSRGGVIGIGASAMQFVPTIAESVDLLTIFQRTPAMNN